MGLEPSRLTIEARPVAVELRMRTSCERRHGSKRKKDNDVSCG